jgi:predicted transcriptional regulator
MVFAGLTTKELSAELGITQFTVQRHMRGDTLPDVQQIVRYCAVLRISADALLRDEAWAPWGSNPQPTDCEDQFALAATG